jgi:hypothetical protein
MIWETILIVVTSAKGAKASDGTVASSFGSNFVNEPYCMLFWYSNNHSHFSISNRQLIKNWKNKLDGMLKLNPPLFNQRLFERITKM